MAVGNCITSAVRMATDRTIPELTGQPVQPSVSTGFSERPCFKDKVKGSHRILLTPSSSLQTHKHMKTQVMLYYYQKIIHIYDHRSQENNRWEIKDMCFSIHSKCGFQEKMIFTGLLFATYTQ